MAAMIRLVSVSGSSYVRSTGGGRTVTGTSAEVDREPDVAEPDPLGAPQARKDHRRPRHRSRAGGRYRLALGLEERRAADGA
jgi:hypothetical protein